MDANSPTPLQPRPAEEPNREAMLVLLRDVLAGRARMAASDYIALVKAINAA